MTINKTITFIKIATVTFLLSGCMSTEYSPYVGSEILHGTGGTVKQQDGIDVWENGTPPRNYRIIGIIDDERGDGIIPQASKMEHIAAKAKEHGGDAVVLLDRALEQRGSHTNIYMQQNYGYGTTNANYREHTKYAVIKYE